MNSPGLESKLENTARLSTSEMHAAQQVKLTNGVAISFVLLLLMIVGWYFETQLSSIEQQSVTVTIESSNSESFEPDTQTLSEMFNNEETNSVVRLVAIEMLDTSLTLELIDRLPPMAEYNEIERQSLVVQAIKLMVKQKHYPEALTQLNKFTLEQRISLELQFSKAIIESRLNLQPAIVSYQQLLQAHPQHQSAIINLSLLYLQQLQPKNAEALLRQHMPVMSATKKAKAYAALGRALDLQSQHESSQAYYLKSIELRPAHAQTWGHLATARAVVFKQHSSINDSFIKAIALDPQNLSLKMNYSFYLIRKMDYLSAIQQLKQARKIGRDRFNIRLWLAFSYSQSNKPINAKKQLSIAAKNVERVRNKTLIAAFQSFLKGDYQTSVDQFKSLLKKNRDNELPYLMIAQGYSKLNKRKSAKVYLDKIESPSKLYFSANLLVAQNHAKSKQFKDSLVVFQRVVEAIDDDWTIFLKISEVAADSGDEEQAVSAIERALGLNRDKSLLLHKAKILWRLGRKTEAIAGLESLVGAKPNYLRAIYRLADYNLQIGNRKESQRFFLRLLAKRADYSDVQLRLATEYVVLAEWDDATVLLKAYLERQSDSKAARLLYARVFCEIGQLVQCKEQLQLVFRLEPNYQPAIDYAAKMGIK